MNLSKVSSTKIVDLFRRVKVKIFGSNDFKTVYESMPFGVDSVPQEGNDALIVSTGDDSKRCVVGYISKNQLESLEAGETRLYSLDPSGDLSRQMILKGDGTIEIGGDSDFAVKYNELETAFNQLKADFDSLVNAYNAHVHTTTATIGTGPVGVIAPTTSTGAASSADITPSKNELIKTN